MMMRTSGTVWCLLFLVFLLVMCNPHSSFCYHMAWGPIYNSFDRKYEDLHPQDVMVDYINRVGLYLLDVHNEDNLHNNIALSPYGAVSVLIALAEGLRGDAALEIYRASHIPHDLTIIRIGLRDIHRHLKTYFIPREGFLAGLTLSHENVTLTASYERILRFYGYNLESFNGVRIPSPSLPSIAPPVVPVEITSRQPPEARTEPRTTPSTTTATAKVTTTTTTTEEVVTVPAPASTTAGTKVMTTEEAVTIPVVEVTTAPVEATTARVVAATAGGSGEEVATTTEGVAVTIPVVEVTTPTTTKAPETTMKVAVEAVETTTAATPEEQASTTTEVISTTTTAATIEEKTGDVESSSSVATVATVTTESEAELIAITTATPETTTTTTTAAPAVTQEILEAVRTMSSANLASRSNVTGKIEMITAINIQTQTKIAVNDDEMDGNSKRNQRSIIDYLIARYYDDYYIPKKYNFPKFRPRIPFFIDGIHRIDRAYFMTYDTILPFFYMPNLDAVALSFPLDSTHYYLLLILPLREDGIDDLICDLKRNPDLKYIIRNMKYTHVKAIIPSFTLRGHVNLTPSLQRLGIEKIFQPHHADFTPMTNNKDVYVTNIEQAITVKIRNYVDLEVASDHPGNPHRYAPVEFKADHPFLYFVMDSQMHVALMAGKIIDPLSSRIR